MPVDTKSLDHITLRESEMRQVQSRIGQLLSELSECEADDGCRIPEPPVSDLSEGIAGLFFRLRHNLSCNYINPESIMIRNKDKDFYSISRQLREQRSELIEKLDDMVDLAVSATRITSWSEIEARFLHLVTCIRKGAGTRGILGATWLLKNAPEVGAG